MPFMLVTLVRVFWVNKFLRMMSVKHLICQYFQTHLCLTLGKQIKWSV